MKPKYSHLTLYERGPWKEEKPAGNVGIVAGSFTAQRKKQKKSACRLSAIAIGGLKSAKC